MDNSTAKTNNGFCSLFLGRFLGSFLFPETKKVMECGEKDAPFHPL
jgi:hypothetical protein